jgi:hypothetical protein
MKYKGHNIPDAEIDKLMDKLDISLEDACETILCDMGVEEDETVEKLTVKAQKNKVTSTIHNAKGEKKERKPREKKENPLKKEIIGRIFELFKVEYGDLMQVYLRNDEKYIDLVVNGREFTINLVEHRQKKG